MKISFLIHNAYGVGGTNRAVLNLAAALVPRHRVEIVSVLRRASRPMFAFADGLRLVPLVDLQQYQPDRTDPRQSLPSRLVPVREEFFRYYSALTDERIAEYLRTTDAEVVVGTRPSLNLLVAQLSRPETVTIAQEHMTHGLIPQTVRDAMRRWYPRLDASTPITQADADIFRRETPIPGLRIEVIADSVEQSRIPPSDRTNKIVVAAGRLDPVKRYDVLIRAFARVVQRRPDWSLRIYGDGTERQNLENLILALGLHNHVYLMGRWSPLNTEWVKGSIAAVSSDRESFGMTIVEAMNCGLPVVSTACPSGPPEIITDGVDGLLVPVGDPDTFAEALLRLIEDEAARHGMGTRAIETGRRYSTETVAGQFEDLCTELREHRRRAVPRSAARRSVNALVLRTQAAGTSVKSMLQSSDRTRTVGEPLLTAIASNQKSRALAEGMLRLGGVGPLKWQTRRIQVALNRRVPPEPEGVGVDCTILPDGRIEFSMAAGRGRRLLRGLVFQRREHAGGSNGWSSGAPTEAVMRFQADEAGGGRMAVSLSMDDPRVASGRWNVCLETIGGRRRRARPGMLDLRRLVKGEATLRYPFHVVLPYRSQDGFLALCVWHPERVAEARAVTLTDDDAIRIEGMVLQDIDCYHQPSFVVSRRGQAPREFIVPGEMDTSGRFRVEVPVSAIVRARLSHEDHWSIALASSDNSNRIRLGRLLDDILDRYRVYQFPPLVVDEENDPDCVVDFPTSDVRVCPRFTEDSEFELVVVDSE